MIKLREIRKSRGLTMAELGKMVGITESAIGLYEKGRRKPDFEMLLKLGEALDCSVDSILGNNYSLDNEEEQLLFYFRQLNNLGKRQLLKQAKNFSEDSDLVEKSNADTVVSA